MADSTPLGADPCEPFLLEIDAALREFFGQSFAVWSICKDSPCLLFDPAAGGAQQAEAPQLSQEFNSALVEAVADRRPRIANSGGQRMLLIALPHGEKGVVVATRRFDQATGITDDWLLRIAGSFVEWLTARGRMRGLQGELHAFAWQMTESYEELTFLHALAECLEISDGAAADRWETARSVLPFLRLALRAESLALIAADYHAGSSEEKPAVGTDVVWEGARCVDDASCRMLIDQFRQEARTQPVVRNRRELDQKSNDHAGRPAGVRDFVLTTMMRHGQVFGWLLAVNRQRDDAPPESRKPAPRWGLSDLEFGSAEASLLVSAASVFAACARNVDLLHQKEHLLVGVVRALVSAIEARDPHTFGHSERVGLTAQRLGEQLGLDRQHCRRLYLTGLLHDVGKIGIADELLRKPGKLTPSEEEQVKKHVELGYAILRDLEQLSFVLPGVLHHHERFDGSGYPHGLAGEEIPLAARVIAVADAYDAMVSDRPYRLRLTDDQAEQQMRRGAGSQFDPAVLDAFFAAISEIRTINRAHQLPSTRREGRCFPTRTARESVEPADVSDLLLSIIPPP
jgi:HD-GYP domain-containing protein (c-di-GMP phosphodiesterase class II)